MSNRKRAMTPAKIQKWIKEGRGEGEGKKYKLWLEVPDVASIGLSARPKGWKTDRVHHFFSNNERYYFYCLEWSPIVVDIREQFPLLPQSRTLEIAESLNVKHPTDPHSHEPIVMTTDFLITVITNGQRRELARTVKPSAELNSKRIIEKLEIERLYWKEKGIDWGVVTDEVTNKPLALNVEKLWDKKDLDGYKGITPEVVELVEGPLFKRLNESTEALSLGAMKVDRELGLEEGTCLHLFFHLLAIKVWTVDMSKEIDTGKPVTIKRLRDYREIMR